MKFDAIVIGAGAAGLFSAIQAGKRGRRVLVLEHNAEPGRKILISGGGRCNFTNTGTTAENFISENPHFAKSALAGFTPSDFVALVRSHGIEYHEKKLGQLFCNGSARHILEMLLTECSRAGVEIRTRSSVERVEKLGDTFVVRTGSGEIETASLVVATGGLSFPKVGATDFGYRIARQFGLRIVNTRPALVPLRFADDERTYAALAGIAIDSDVSIGKTSFRENILFTHHGLSGPAILQISNYWTPEGEVSINLLPGKDAAQILEAAGQSKRSVASIVSELLPKRFADVFLESPERLVSQLGERRRREIGNHLNNWRVHFGKTEGFHKAEVTSGGVATSELSSKTLESKSVSGLYFIGEVVDVTGWLGGYNFQWAWASGFAAGKAI